MAAEFDPYAADLYISPLRINALQLNELYKELLSVGFKSQEALYLVGQVLVSGIMIPYEDNYQEDERDEQEFNDDDEDGDFF
jgi:hypothetical protein